jgi:GAF domain-containing protein
MMSDDALRLVAIDELQSVLLQTHGIEEFMGEVAGRVARHVAPGTHGSITLRRPRGITSVATSDDRAARCDAVEYEKDSGPCIAAIEDGQIRVVSDLRTDERWPEWREAALDAGFLSGAAVPVEVKEGVSMALNLYSEQVDAWTETALHRAAVYAQEMARTMKISLRSEEQAAINADLRAALASRATIDQAMGVIMAQNKCSADEAFRILRSASQHRNVKLRDIAAAVIEGVTGFAPSKPTEFRHRTEFRHGTSGSGTT